MRVLALAGLIWLLPLYSAYADAVIASCPQQWTFGGEERRLEWANVWADYQAIDNDIGEGRERPGKAVVHIDMTKVKRLMPLTH
jgi:hypothetical protein